MDHTGTALTWVGQHLVDLCFGIASGSIAAVALWLATLYVLAQHP